MNSRWQWLLTGAAAAAALGAAGCAADFEPQSKIQSLRILGVQKSAPYAAPGEEVTLSALWTLPEPAEGETPPKVTFGWLGGCFNPPADLYYGCFQGLSPSQSTGGIGNQFTLEIPADIISSRPPPKDPTITPYGLAYVFFAACAGKLQPVTTSGGAQEFPATCVDPDTGAQLNQDSFVVGYTAIYAYDTLRHDNPVITAFQFNGQTLAPDCIGTACLGPPPAPPVSCDEPGTVCIPRCDGGGKCPEYSAAPVVAESSFDPTPTAQGAERIWVNYYVDRGSVTSDLQLIAAATPGVGWLTEYSTKVVAPAEPGPMLLWSVVRDSRGGQNWTRLKVLVE